MSLKVMRDVAANKGFDAQFPPAIMRVGDARGQRLFARQASNLPIIVFPARGLPVQ